MNGTPAAIRIALLYLVISMAWIVLSDQAAIYLVADPDTLTLVQTWKGWAFVAVTAFLLGWLVQREVHHVEETQKALIETQVALSQHEQRYQRMFSESPLPMWVYDTSDYRTLAVNQAAIDHYGYSREEWLNLSLMDLRPKDRDSLPQDPLLQLLPDIRNKGVWRHAKKDGTTMDVEIASHDLDFEGHRARMVVAIDITERRRAESRIYHLAYFDPLTSLPNRTLLIDRLQAAIDDARSGEHLALMFFDLDRFKDINDSLGHEAGDRMLKEVAVRLDRIAPPGTTVARLSGDLYALLVRDADSRMGREVAEKALACLSSPMDLGSVCMMATTACLGISLYPDDATDAATLMRNADAALHHAISQGRNQYAFYEASMNIRSMERLALENELRQALDRKEFILHYQPQLSLAGEITGTEALVRWQHPQKGMLPPGYFITTAEEVGLIVPLGTWVLREACRQAKQWQDKGLPAITMAVNLSAVQFLQPDLAKQVAAILDETGLPARCLELEVTETILMRDADSVETTLHTLRSMGVQISIDDFGTGYSSLAYLGHLPVTKLKIDQSFVRKLPGDPAAKAITTTIITLAKNMNLSVIAEGVETQAQADFLQQKECEEAQGYLFSRPLPAAEAESFIRSKIA